jgi:hypothetical protein
MSHDPSVADYRATSPADGGGILLLVTIPKLVDRRPPAYFSGSPRRSP